MEMDDNDNFVDVSYQRVIVVDAKTWRGEQSREKQTFFSVCYIPQLCVDDGTRINFPLQHELQPNSKCFFLSLPLA